jgi:oxazoline/thiazoline dehydrogenase
MDDLTAPPYVLAFRDGLRAAEDVAPGLLHSLASGGATERELLDRAAEAGVTEQAKIIFHLERYKRRGMLTFTATCDLRPLATLIPTVPTRPAIPREAIAGVRYALSRFAYLRCDGSHLLLETPLGFAKALLFDPRASALFHLLAEPRTLDQLSHELPSLPRLATIMLMGIFLGCGAVVREDELDVEDAAPLAGWTFHDLLFHVRSRKGRHADVYCATYPLQGRLEPLPAIKARMNGPRITLPRPDLAAIAARDPPLCRALEQRRSIHRHAEQPIHLDQVAEFLYRSARVRAFRESSPSQPYETTSRPYPAGGACYELEVYLIVAACEGLQPGAYHYDPLEHALTTLATPAAAAAALLHDARTTMAVTGPLHTVVVLSARFGRLSWKYESIAYATVLKDVGALVQTMYLVATAMNLAPCALGIGDSDLFADAIGLDYYEETSVGEFALGARSPDAPPDAAGYEPA